jgi:hypothetical protein
VNLTLVTLSVFAMLPTVVVMVTIVIVIVSMLHVDLARRLAHEAAGHRRRPECDPQNGKTQTAQSLSHGGASSLRMCI